MNFLDNINISEEREVICLTNSEGIHLYDIVNFQLLMKFLPYRIGLIGDVYKTKIFYNSQIIAFIIIETEKINSFEEFIIYNDSKIKKYSLVIYDMKNYEILAKITMKNSVEINDFLITRFFIIIMIENKNKILLFKTSNLEYFKSISDAEHSSLIYSDDYYYYKYKYNYKEKNKNIAKDKINKCIIVYKDISNKKIVVRTQFIFNEDKTKIIGYKKKNLEINLNSNDLKYIGLISSYLIASSAYDNKVHIYDLFTGRFKYCLILGNFPYEISGISLDNKQKIISIITNNKYLRLYKLNKLALSAIVIYI
jgi:WD40 repeat protein